jgi:hypothetical protein
MLLAAQVLSHHLAQLWPCLLHEPLTVPLAVKLVLAVFYCRAQPCETKDRIAPPLVRLLVVVRRVFRHRQVDEVTGVLLVLD